MVRVEDVKAGENGRERRTRMKRRRSIGATLLLVFGLGVVATAWSADGVMADAAIRVFQFQPGALEVRAGTRVTWTNQDDITHTVTSGLPGSPDGWFDVQLAGKGTSGSATFADPGVYPYFCARHPSMRGEVVVR
jgi:plastocyanin